MQFCISSCLVYQFFPFQTLWKNPHWFKMIPLIFKYILVPLFLYNYIFWLRFWFPFLYLLHFCRRFFHFWFFCIFFWFGGTHNIK